MSAVNKQMVKQFLRSDFFVQADSFDSFFHPDFGVHWLAISGYLEFDFKDYHRLKQVIAGSYESKRADISHMINENDDVACIFTINTLENSTKGLPVRCLIPMFKIKDHKVTEVYQLGHTSHN